MPVNCGALKGAIAQDQCLLDQSMQLDPPPNCVSQATQLDMNVCSYRDYLRADIKLNETWKATFKAGSPVATKLLEAQRAWIAFRDAQCDAAGERYAGGTMQALATNGCLIELTKRRIEDLQAFWDNN